MNDLAKEVENFKGKIENANQLIEESNRLVDILGVAVEKVVIFDKSAADLEEKYQSINKENNEIYQELVKKQEELLNKWNVQYTEDLIGLGKKADDFAKDAIEHLEKYQDINRENNERNFELVQKQNEYLKTWKIQQVDNQAKFENKIEGKFKFISILSYIIIGLLIMSVLIIKLG